jgi:uncharacterized membrane protein YvlD (DUF360 family)
VIRFLIRTAIFFLAALVGLLVADLLLSGFSLDVSSYISVAIIFALIQAIVAPLMGKLVQRNAEAFTGGVGLVSAFVALLVTDLLSSGLTIEGASTWLMATLLVWLGGALAAFLLPYVFLKGRIEERNST